MASALLSHAPTIRMGAFAGMFAVMVLWEVLAPRRQQAAGCWRYWPANSEPVGLDGVLVRLTFPTAAVGVALFAQPMADRKRMVSTLTPACAARVPMVMSADRVDAA